MFDIAREMLAELDAGRALGAVVVTAVYGSAPRAIGSAMAVTEDGRAIGSISGGCVEAEAYELALAVLESGEPCVTALGGPDDPFASGLSCGGTLRVLVKRFTRDDAEVVDALRASLDADGSASASDVTLTLDVEGAAFVLRRARPPRMVIVGAVDFSGALADAARLLGYRVDVVDPRPVFATAERFPGAHRVAIAWPDAYLRALADQAPLTAADSVCVLTHQERLDVPALVEALASGAGYVGAMGSRLTHERRLVALHAAGVDDAALARLHSPIGLDLGGSTPAETAVAILGEIIAAGRGASGVPLGEVEGPIHAAHSRTPAAALAGSPVAAAPAASLHTLSRDIGSS